MFNSRKVRLLVRGSHCHWQTGQVAAKAKELAENLSQA